MDIHALVETYYGSLPALLTVSVATCILIAIYLTQASRTRKRLPLPPGPKPLPIVGNIFDVPFFHQWLTFKDFSVKYNSDIIYLSLLGNDVVILNSSEAVTDLLERKSSIYSSRPRMPMLNELCGWAWATSVMEYGPYWRKHRKAFHQHFNIVASKAYIDLQVLQTRKMMRRLVEMPGDFREHIKYLTNATILKILYGIDVEEHDDPYIAASERALEGAAAAGIPGSFLVDVFPLLMHVPSWMPGARFKTRAKAWRKACMEFLNDPFEAAKAAKVKADGTVPVAIRLLHEGSGESGDSPEDAEEIAKQVAGMSYIGGSDTTTSSLATFFMAMALYPEVQTKGQAEVDALLGSSGRLPDFADQQSLPYVQALCKEVLRWQLVLPLALAHCVMEEDEYRGYRIPRGAVVFGNAWAISHDERYYDDPHSFRPERFLKDGKLNPDVLDPEKAAFGFGRRSCPGKHMAINSMLVAISTVLTCFNIAHAKDKDGNDIPIEAKMTPGLMSYPVEFECAVTPRSKDIAGRILRSIDALDGVWA